MVLTSAAVRIYTKRGDDGRTGLFYGGRIGKDAAGPEAYGTVDEAVAALGVARAVSPDDLAERLLAVQRDLFVVAAELATDPANREKLQPGKSLVTSAMVEGVEARIDEVVEAVGLPDEFVVPGENPLAAALDVARTIVRRAERRSVTLVGAAGEARGSSHVVPYLNRLADYLYVLARAAESEWTSTRGEDQT